MAYTPNTDIDDVCLRFSIWADAKGKTIFPVFLGDKPTGETVSYLQCYFRGKWYRVSFEPSKETSVEAMPRLEQLLKEEANWKNPLPKYCGG